MSARYKTLTEKEKQTLRLIVRGHDAKSIARHLELSVHTVNERLRDARRKLQVSSSREAARMVFDTEGDTPEKHGDKQIGEASEAGDMPEMAQVGSGSHRQSHRTAWIITGVVIMSIVLGLLALSMALGGIGQTDGKVVPSSAQTGTIQPAQESDVTRAARNWLTLHDEGRWADAYKGTGDSFRKYNTLERWTAAATQVRPPLGAVLSRTLISQDSVPAGPRGVEVVKFRTSFANKADVIETVSLVHEGEQWKVAGIYVD